jgi:hypothetical protein
MIVVSLVQYPRLMISAAMTDVRFGSFKTFLTGLQPDDPKTMKMAVAIKMK